MLTKHKFTALAMSGVLVLTATAAYAVSHLEEDGQAIGQTRVSLSQAIDAAEKSAPGSRATHANFERDHQGHWTFTVEVAKAGQAMDVTVDPSNGQILSVSHDREDYDYDYDYERD